MLDQTNIKGTWSKRVMHLPVKRFKIARWDNLTRERKAAEHERYEIECAVIDREKTQFAERQRWR